MLRREERWGQEGGGNFGGGGARTGSDSMGIRENTNLIPTQTRELPSG